MKRQIRHETTLVQQDPPCQPFAIKLEEIGAQTVIRHGTLQDMLSELPSAIQRARLKSMKDGQTRTVVIEQCVLSTMIAGEKEPLKMSEACKRLFMAEIDNEEKGGDKPATLNSGIESLISGYTPYPEGFDANAVITEMKVLASMFGDNAELDCFLTATDWENRQSS